MALLPALDPHPARHAHSPEPRRPSRLARVQVLAALGLAVLAACDGGETARARGDRLWADSAYLAALAEYRLALREGGTDDETLLRLAHAYVATGQTGRARETYGRLLARAPEHTDQAVYDFVRLARAARRRRDSHGMAGAVEAALELRPELPLPDLAKPLARYYAAGGETERALMLYDRALSQESPDSAASLLFEIGVLQEKHGSCPEAIGYFEAYRRRAPEGTHAADAAWRSGNCAFALARRARLGGLPADALAYLAIVLELGVPEGVQVQAWFERGEILYALGRMEEAAAAYQTVVDLGGGGSGQLTERARRRVLEIRLGV